MGLRLVVAWTDGALNVGGAIAGVLRGCLGWGGMDLHPTSGTQAHIHQGTFPVVCSDTEPEANVPA